VRFLSRNLRNQTFRRRRKKIIICSGSSRARQEKKKEGARKENLPWQITFWDLINSIGGNCKGLKSPRAFHDVMEEGGLVGAMSEKDPYALNINIRLLQQIGEVAVDQETSTSS